MNTNDYLRVLYKHSLMSKLLEDLSHQGAERISDQVICLGKIIQDDEVPRKMVKELLELAENNDPIAMFCISDMFKNGIYDFETNLFKAKLYQRDSVRSFMDLGHEGDDIHKLALMLVCYENDDLEGALKWALSASQNQMGALIVGLFSELGIGGAQQKIVAWFCYEWVSKRQGLFTNLAKQLLEPLQQSEELSNDRLYWHDQLDRAQKGDLEGGELIQWVSAEIESKGSSSISNLPLDTNTMDYPSSSIEDPVLKELSDIDMKEFEAISASNPRGKPWRHLWYSFIITFIVCVILYDLIIPRLKEFNKKEASLTATTGPSYTNKIKDEMVINNQSLTPSTVPRPSTVSPIRSAPLNGVKSTSNPIVSSEYSSKIPQPSWCSRAKIKTEQIICAEESLWELDNDYLALYRTIDVEQRNHLGVKMCSRGLFRETYACKDDIECIRQAYEKRIQYWKEVGAGHIDCPNVFIKSWYGVFNVGGTCLAFTYERTPKASYNFDFFEDAGNGFSCGISASGLVKDSETSWVYRENNCELTFKEIDGELQVRFGEQCNSSYYCGARASLPEIITIKPSHKIALKGHCG